MSEASTGRCCSSITPPSADFDVGVLSDDYDMPKSRKSAIIIIILIIIIIIT